LNGLLLNEALRTIRDERDRSIKLIRGHNLPPEDEQEYIKQANRSAVLGVQDWLTANVRQEVDGTFIIDLGHVKLMVNEEQLKYVMPEHLLNL
jgi:hypothetical protein